MIAGSMPVRQEYPIGRPPLISITRRVVVTDPGSRPSYGMTARMMLRRVAPEGYAAVAALEQYVKDSLDHGVLHLVKLRASMLNGCSFCVDMHSREALASGEDSRRLFSVAAWHEATWFDARERAALALTDEVTRLGPEGVRDEVWEQACAVWSEREVADLVLAIATINVWNRISISSRTAPPQTPA